MHHSGDAISAVLLFFMGGRDAPIPAAGLSSGRRVYFHPQTEETT